MAKTASHGGDSRQRPTSGSSRRSQLLAIAARLFAERGYAQTTVRDIADEAGILSGSLYHHFDSKESMACEVLSELMDGLQTRFAEVVERSSGPRDALDGLVRAAYDVIHNKQDAVATYQNESAVFAALPAFEFVTEASLAIEAIWRAVLDEGRANGVFRPDIDPALAYLSIREAVWSTVRWYNPAGKYTHEALADQFLMLLHAGLAVRE
ncbi:TetR/AcrR family transcriptional regulator [Rhodococcus sp. IEGM1428]|uniref:TetR/AcrR family transcriptional regulator n=1 Tax=Rhodococcus sp. IEGM1428 TaxID=3392191 RepID=UPI003D13A71F